MKTGLALFLFALLACWPPASFAGEDVQTRFEKSLNDARSITNVEIQFLDTLCIGDPASLKGMKINKPVFSWTFRYSYTASGQKYRAVATLVSGTETNLVQLSESTFDGKTYATYSSASSRMTIGSNRPEPGEGESADNPLIAPFKFLNRSSDDRVGRMVHFTDLVTPGLTNGLILLSGQATNGVLEVSLAGPVMGNQPMSCKILIDEAGDAFTPKEVDSVIPGCGEMKQRLLNYTNLGAYKFPTRIEWTASKYCPTSPPALFATGTVMVISARIPDQVPDSVFRLESEAASAEAIWDRDRKQFAIEASKYTNAIALAKARPKIYDESADGSKQIADALETASREHKDVLLLFGANDCGWCHKLHALFETNQIVASELKRSYLVVMIDRNKGHNSDVETRYGNPSRFGWPSIVVLGPKGTQLTTQDTGKLEEEDHCSPVKMLAFLKEWAPQE